MKISAAKIISYLQGHYRYKLYYSINWSFLIRDHIKEQIYTRIKSMDRKCFNDGSCKKCGCPTTHLQMANRPCEGECYPRMLNKKEWEYISKGNMFYIDDKLWQIKQGLFKKVIR